MAKLETFIEYRERLVRSLVAEYAPDAPGVSEPEAMMMRAYLASVDYSPSHIAHMILDTRE